MDFEGGPRTKSRPICVVTTDRVISISVNDSCVKLQCNLTKESDGRWGGGRVGGLLNRALLARLRPKTRNSQFRRMTPFAKVHCNLTKDSEGGPPLVNRAPMALLRPNAKFAIYANDCIFKLQCNLT